MTAVNSAVLFSEDRAVSQDTFNPAHIRPSGVGGCLREQWFRILNAVYPEDLRFKPSNPEGKKAIEGVAQLGHIIENALAELWSKNYPGKTYRQYNLSHPELTNLDGTQVTAHPDIWVPSLSTDVEVKSASVSARNYLPVRNHTDQLLLRILWWRKYKNRVVVGEIPYIFRETFFDPDTHTVPVFKFVPEEGGYQCENTGELYPWDYINSLEERLISLRRALDTQDPPERSAKSHREFPCKLTTPKYSTECPWREVCWAKELAEERDPGYMAEAAKEIIIKLVDAKNRQKAIDRAASEAKDEVKVLQKELDFFFDEFGKKINAGSYMVTRSEVNIPEKIIPEYSFYRYSVKEIKPEKQKATE